MAAGHSPAQCHSMCGRKLKLSPLGGVGGVGVPVSAVPGKCLIRNLFRNALFRKMSPKLKSSVFNRQVEFLVRSIFQLRSAIKRKAPVNIIAVDSRWVVDIV